MSQQPMDPRQIQHPLCRQPSTNAEYANDSNNKKGKQLDPSVIRQHLPGVAEMILLLRSKTHATIKYNEIA